MRIVVSVDGSTLIPNLQADRIKQYAEVLAKLAEDHDLAAVIGGGRVAHDYIETAHNLNANEIQLDQLGIAVTRLNAQLLIAALGERAAPTPAMTLEEVGETLRRNEVAVMGRTAPGHTTDATAAALAESVNADLIVFATSVLGVRDIGTTEDADIQWYDELMPDELVETISGLEQLADTSAPIDLLAAKLIQRARIPSILLDGTDPERIIRAVANEGVEGTEVTPHSR